MLDALQVTKTRSAWRRYTRPGVFVLVTGVSLYLLLPSLAAVFASWHSLTSLTWYWVLLALASEAASFVAIWQLDRIALREQRWFVVASAQLAGNAAGRVVPGGAATATAVSVGMLRRAGHGVGQATAALAASTTLQVATRLALPLLALPAIVAGASVAPSLATTAYLGLAVVLVLAGVGVLAFVSDRPLAAAGRALQWALNGTVRRRRKITGLSERLLVQRDFVRVTIGPNWKAAVLSAVATAGCDFAALLFTLRAVGAEPRPSLVLLAYSGAGLLALIPLTPGGLGFVEAGLVGTLTLAGVSAADSTLATLTYRLASYWLPIPFGVAAYIAFARRCGVSAEGQRAPRFARASHRATVGSSNSTRRSSMDSLVQRAGRTADSDLKRVRWAIGINGVLSIAFGVVILIWPDISLYALTIVFGAFTAANGVVGLSVAMTSRMKDGRGWLVLMSLLAIAVGVIALVWTDISALALLYVIGAYAIGLGILTIGGAFWLPFLDGGDKALLTLTGIASIVFGVVMFAKPGDGALVLLALIAAFSLVRGLSEVVVAIGWKRLLEADLKRAVSRSRPRAQPASS